MSHSRPRRSWVFSLAILDAVVTGLSNASSMYYAWNAETENPYLSTGISLAFGTVMAVSCYFLRGKAMIQELTEDDSPPATPDIKSNHSQFNVTKSQNLVAAAPASPKPTASITTTEFNFDSKTTSTVSVTTNTNPDSKSSGQYLLLPTSPKSTASVPVRQDACAITKKEEKVATNSNFSIMAQSAYTVLSSLSSGSTRYFAVHATLKLFSDAVNPVSLWPILLLTTLLIERPFTLTNEDAETNSAIAARFTRTVIPCYGRLFSPCTSPTIRTLFRHLGSLDHMTIEMLSISGYLSKQIIDDLKKPENELTRNLVVSIGGVVGIYCAAWIFVQTYFFEGRYTNNFLLTIIKKLKQVTSTEEQAHTVDAATRCSPNCFCCFKTNITLIGTLKHGESAASPVFNVGRSLSQTFPSHSTEIMITTIGATAFTGIINALVTYFAEIKHTIDEFAPEDLESQKTTLIRHTP